MTRADAVSKCFEYKKDIFKKIDLRFSKPIGSIRTFASLYVDLVAVSGPRRRRLHPVITSCLRFMIPVRREVKRNFSDFSLLDNVVGGENSFYSRLRIEFAINPADQ